MEDQSLLVFAKQREGMPLQVISDALHREGYPAELGIGIVGTATAEELAEAGVEAVGV